MKYLSIIRSEDACGIVIVLGLHLYIMYFISGIYWGTAEFSQDRNTQAGVLRWLCSLTCTHRAIYFIVMDTLT